MNRTLISAGLIGLLLGSPVNAGQVYGSCGQSYSTGYVSSYTPTYVSGPTYYPAGYYPATTSYSTYTPTDYTFYRPGSDIINTRLAQEAATAAVDKFKAELATQQAQQAAAMKEQADAQWKQQITLAIQALGQQRAGPPVDPEVARLQAENEQMRATLKRIIEGQRGQPAASGPKDIPPPVPVPKDGLPPIPNVPQPGPADGPGKPADQNVLQAFKQAVDSKCIKCHGSGEPERMQLGHPERMTYEDYGDCITRMARPANLKGAMPKDKPGTCTGDDVLPFQLLQVDAPHRSK